VTTPTNGQQKARAIPVLVVLPTNAVNPQIQAVAQWHTGTGILCPPQQIPAQILQPLGIAELFVALIKLGRIGQQVQQEDGSWVECDLPVLHFVVRDPPRPAPVEDDAPVPELPPARRIILPGG
jgi:hypothetical protein